MMRIIGPANKEAKREILKIVLEHSLVFVSNTTVAIQYPAIMKSVVLIVAKIRLDKVMVDKMIREKVVIKDLALEFAHKDGEDASVEGISLVFEIKSVGFIL